MAQPLWIQKKKMVLVVKAMLRLSHTKTMPTTNTQPSTNSCGIRMAQDLRTLCKQGRLKEALNILHVMDQQGIRPGSSVYTFLLQECVNRKALSEGKLIHAHMIDSGFNPDIFLQTKLVIMYAKCGSLIVARQILDGMPTLNVVSWTAMIAAYARHGYDEGALRLFYQMRRTGIQPNQFTFSSVLPACANLGALEQGKKIHEEVIRRGFQSDVFVASALVDMYVKCGKTEDACQVFDKMPERDEVSWNAMIAGYAQNGHVDNALKLFQKMPERDTISWNAMIAGYAQNGFVEEALELLCIMPERNVVSWTAIIAAYVRNGHNEEALELFYQMQRAGIQPDQFTFASVLSACANLAALEHGKNVHENVIRSGFKDDVFVGSALIDMYVQSWSTDDARKVFDKMPERDEVSWNAMIAGYAQNGYVGEALKLFQKMGSGNAMIARDTENRNAVEAWYLFGKIPERNVVSWTAMIAAYGRQGCDEAALKMFDEMQRVGIQPNQFTFASVLLACSNLAALEHGKMVHQNIIRSGFHSDACVGSALVDLYAKCGSIENACRVFDKMSEPSIISWNVLIAGYAQNGLVDQAVRLFHKMPERDVVSWNEMIAGYAQNGHVDHALELFNKMPERDVVSWNAMIAGYAQNGHFNEALMLFDQQMQLTGVKPNAVTFASVLPACANLAALEHGKLVHENIIRSGFQTDGFVGSALVDMYVKCGSVEDARKVFDKMPEKCLVSWNAMIVGYALHGRGKEALQLFEQMQHSGTKPGHVTFIGVLSACCHAGLVDDGWQYFDCMSQDYHITPALEHYCCMVDLLGRAGLLNQACDFINKMPVKPNTAVWGSLLGACRIHNNIELGQHVAEHLFELEPENASYYVLLSNIYTAVGRWDDAEKVQKLMKDRGIKKKPGCSWIEVNNKLYAFLAGDSAHPQMHKICAKLEELSGQIKEAGYVPDTNCVLHDVEEQQKEHILCHHSEKLAIAFGLIHTSPGTPIRIIKNLRVCGDCHSAVKFISKIVAREIVVRDANRFHHFKDGQCSCQGYW